MIRLSYVISLRTVQSLGQERSGDGNFVLPYYKMDLQTEKNLLETSRYRFGIDN
jgi:hypothetical protein